jgi:hypothetical protein
MPSIVDIMVMSSIADKWVVEPPLLSSKVAAEGADDASRENRDARTSRLRWHLARAYHDDPR